MSKHRQEIITLQIPQNPVDIIDVAEPNMQPVSPNLFLNVLLSIFVGLECWSWSCLFYRIFGYVS